MNFKVVILSAIIMAVAISSVNSTLAITATTAAGASLFALTASQSTALVGGLLLLKKAALLAGALSSRRGRREVMEEMEDESPAFAVIASAEPDQCYKRLICDLATGSMPKSENDVILGLFEEETPIANPKFDYMIAAKLGKELKSIQSCEVRYSCPVSGSTIQKLFKA